MMDLTSCPTAMNFTENQQGSVILDKLRAQKNEGRFCDVVFHVRDKAYLAHRNVLAAFSPYFESMLKVNKVTKEHMTVNCSNQRIFETLLDYVYTGKVVIDSTSVKDLVSLANQFMMTKLKGYCCEYMERNLGVSNCFLMRDLADKCNLVSLVKTVDAFMLANIVQVWDQAEVLDFTESRLEIMLSNKTMPVTEDLKLQLICKWTRHDISEREKKFGILLSYVNWPSIQVTVLYGLLRQEVLFSQSEWCMYFMLKAMEDKGLLFNVYSDTLRMLRAKLGSQEAAVNPTPSSVQQTVPLLPGHSQVIDSQPQLACAQNQTVYIHQTPVVSLANQGKIEVKKAEDDKCVSDPNVGSQLQEDLLSSSVPNVNNNIVEDVELGLQDSGDESSDGDEDIDTSLIEEDVSPTDEVHNELLHLTASTTEVSDEGLSMEDLEKESSILPSEGDATKKNRRKGVPVRVRIQKSKIKKVEIKLPPKSKMRKRRGRPRKVPLGDRIKGVSHGDADLTKTKQSIKIRVKKRVTDIEEYSDNEENYISEDVDGKPRKRKYPENRAKRKKVETLSCPICPYTTVKGEERMKSHMKKNHSEDTTFQCSECNYSCKWNREFNQHLRTHFPGPPYHCDTEGCAYSVDRLNLLMLHRMKHTDERPHECSVCNAKFRSRNNLTSHLRCHTGEKPFQCPVCNRCFATKGTLEQHSVTHSDARPYLCDHCGFSTKYQSHLISHMRIHKGDVFKCQYPNCKYTTPKRSQLACHMRSHMSIRSHICSVCGRGFVEKSHLVRHERIHLEEKPFKCYLCEYSSTRRDKLKEHNLKYHSSEVGSSPPKTPYKPRKSRRQTFDPQLYPGVSQGQAQAQIEQMIQQTEESHPAPAARRQLPQTHQVTLQQQPQQQQQQQQQQPQQQPQQPQQSQQQMNAASVGRGTLASQPAGPVVTAGMSQQVITGVSTATTGLQVPTVPSSLPAPQPPPAVQDTATASFTFNPGGDAASVSAVTPATSETVTMIPASSAPTSTTTTLDGHALGLFIDPRVQSLMASQSVALIQPASSIDPTAFQASSQAVATAQPQSQTQVQPTTAGQDYAGIHTFMSIF